VSIIAWIVLGAIAGYLAGMLVRGDEGLGIIGHWHRRPCRRITCPVFFAKPIDGPLTSARQAAVIGAILVVAGQRGDRAPAGGGGIV
jgi:uncharacterized membrane protein YeaQ/YmgE (transglycosylase-associated protein family)